MDVDIEKNLPTLEQFKALNKIYSDKNTNYLFLGYNKKALTKSIAQYINTEEMANRMKSWFSVNYI